MHYPWLLIIVCRNQLKLASMPSSSFNSSRDVESSSDEDSDESDDEDTPTRELVVWRSAVSSATSAAQLGIYITQLNQTIAWEKSIMKVVRQLSVAFLYHFVTISSHYNNGSILHRCVSSYCNNGFIRHHCVKSYYNNGLIEFIVYRYASL